MYGALPNQYYPIATVLEDEYAHQSSLGVDEHGILWDDQYHQPSAASLPLERR